MSQYEPDGYRHRNGCWSVITPGRPCDCRDLHKHIAKMAETLLRETERLLEEKMHSGRAGESQ